MLESSVERIWRKDPSFWADDATDARSVATRLGWLDAPGSMLAHVAELRSFGDEIRHAGFSDIVVLGMGGSSLAPEVLRRTSPGRQRLSDRQPRLHVLDTTDPQTILSLTACIELSNTLFFVSSKSGSTIEANVLFEYFEERVAAATNASPGQHFVAITDPGSPLERLAKDRGFRRVFLNPADVGGRYSALTYFGLAPAAAVGLDVERLLFRAERATARARSGASDALQFGAALGELAQRGRNKLTFITSPTLAPFGLWAEQLIAESTGKNGVGIVPIDLEPLARPRQYGDDRVFVYLRLEADSNGHTDAVAGSLAAEGLPVIQRDLDDAYDLGREFFDWEFATAVAGQILGINPFDEPNVQESKDNTSRVLRGFEETRKLDIPALEDRMPVAYSPSFGASSLEPAVARFLGDIKNGQYLAIVAYIAETQVHNDEIEEIRRHVRDALGIATTLGYGPRHLHSTGQLHKGGPPIGLFLQVTASDTTDIPIPGRPYTFGQLKRAQAIGDFESITSRDLPVLRVHLQTNIAAGLGALKRAVAIATSITA
jgi:glucose-6-phosphate isomerase